MKKISLIVGLALLCSPAFAEEKVYPGPQEGAPNIYHQVFDNERARVSEITFKPGDKAAMHTHPYDHIVYVIDGGELTITSLDGKSTVLTAKAGDALWMGKETHEAVNTGITTLRGTVTELK